MCDKVNGANIGGLILLGIAICAAIAGIVVNQLTASLDDDGEAFLYCGWQEVYCNEDWEYKASDGTKYDCDDFMTIGLYPFEWKNHNYADQCDNKGELFTGLDGKTYIYTTQDECETETAGIMFLATTCIGIVLCAINMVLLLVGVKKVSMVVGIFASIAFGVAIAFWGGFTGEDFDGNPFCWDHDSFEDEDIAFGASIYMIMGSSVLSLIGAILSCCD